MKFRNCPLRASFLSQHEKHLRNNFLVVCLLGVSNNVMYKVPSADLSGVTYIHTLLVLLLFLLSRVNDLLFLFFTLLQILKKYNYNRKKATWLRGHKCRRYY